MKNKLLKDVAAHYNLVNSKMSPEAIKSHIKLALDDLYCAFCGFDSHIEGGEMVCHGCSFGSYSNASLRSVKDVLNTLQYKLYLNGYSLSQNCMRATKRVISICSRAYHWHVSPSH